MLAKGKSPLSQILDLPLAIAGLLTLAYYWLVTQPSMAGTLLAHYTTEHAVEYVVVAFFLWGLTDAVYRGLCLPREILALAREWLPRRGAREPAARAAAMLAHLKTRPRWQLESRLGQRLTQALGYLQEKGSADDFGEYLRHLADQDLETTHTNYGLIRFICVITPMFGFLGTVVHFGTALGGQSAGDIADKLPTVVAEMGTAFNTTTIALIAATTMMFALFVSERAERAIVFAIDRRTNEELLNRFEVVDASMAPYLAALELTNKASVAAIGQLLERQLSAWSATLDAFKRHGEAWEERQSQIWVAALERIDERYESNDANREKRLLKLLEKIESHRQEHTAQARATADQLTGLQADFARLVEQLVTIAASERQLVGSQSLLSENLRVLREAEHLDQAFHGLTAAIHMLTARHAPGGREARAA